MQLAYSIPAALLSACGLALIASPAHSQIISATPGTALGASGGRTLIAQAISAPAVTNAVINRAPTTTILPTDVIPLPTIQNRMTFGENLQLRILQKLPARFYFSGSVETSFRYETNVFQFPTKRVLLRKLLPDGTNFYDLAPPTQISIFKTLQRASSEDNIYRVLPSCSGGWTLTPRTRVYGTFFMIRDSLFKHSQLNTDIFSYAWGMQHDFQIGSRANLQADMQFRELNQAHQHSLFDFLPGLTLSVVATPRTVVFANALAQLRGKAYMQAPTREIDPFYTWGLYHQRGRWTFSASTTFVQNFREPFRNNASIPLNSYSFISDFEIDRRILPQIPGLQAFVRAEPIWNFHTHNRPGLAGMDFRFYYGLRMSMSKPALTTALDSLRRQLEEQEVEPPSPSQPGPKPSAFISPQEVIASSPQPMHGFMPETSAMDGTTASCTPVIYSPANTVASNETTTID